MDEDALLAEESLFNLKAVSIPKRDANLKITKLASSASCIIWIAIDVTKKISKVFRWRFDDEECKQYDLPVRPEETNVSAWNLAGTIVQVAGNVLKSIGEDKTKVNAKVDHIFIDPKGHHAILSSNEGDNYYFHFNSESVYYIRSLKDKKITAIGWDKSDFGEESDEAKDMASTKVRQQPE